DRRRDQDPNRCLGGADRPASVRYEIVFWRRSFDTGLVRGSQFPLPWTSFARTRLSGYNRSLRVVYDSGPDSGPGEDRLSLFSGWPAGVAVRGSDGHAPAATGSMVRVGRGPGTPPPWREASGSR